MDGFYMAPVTDFSIFTGASVFAGDSDIDDFILNDAQWHYQRKMAVTYALTVKQDSRVIAFATLQNDAIKLASGRDGFPYKFYPAVKIGRLGVAQPYQQQGLGSLFINMIAKFMCHENRTGCRFITLDAYNCDKTINFYQKNGFEMLRPTTTSGERRTIPMYRDLL
jgi:hypothetical protein vspiD_27615